MARVTRLSSEAFRQRIIAGALYLCCLVLTGLLLPTPGFADAGGQAPVAAYSFDAGEGTTAEDVTGNGHEGTIEGATWTNGKYGKALSFESNADCVTVPESPELQLGEELTLEAWVKPEGSQEDGPVIFKETAGYVGYVLGLGFHEGGKVEGYIDPEGGEKESTRVSSSGSLEENVWTHLALTYDGAHMRLYVNGELVATKALSGAYLSGEGPLFVGCDGSEETFRDHFEGKIDEPRIYNRALNAGEIAADAAAPIQTPQAAPVAAYSFDAGEGTTAEDVTGNGHEGTIEGAEWVKGKYGDGLGFNAAEEDIVTIPTSPDLDLEEFTLEAWVKPSEINSFEPVIAKTDPEGFGYKLMAGGDEESALPEGFITEGESTHRYAYDEHQLDLHAWTHIAVTSDGSKMRFYIDGELVDTRNGDDVLAGGDAPLQIGGNESFASPELFDGVIDEVRIYNRALNAGEIAADAAAPIQTPQAGPVAAYSFDAGEGTTAEDVTGNGHEGTIEGATWTNGKYGKALSFESNADCVTVPESSELQLGEELTLEAWVKPEGSQEDGPVIFKETAGYVGYVLGLGFHEGGKVEGYIDPEGGEKESTRVSSSGSLEENVWTHLALTYDGAHMRLYVNGELVATKALSGAYLSGEGPLFVGCDGSEETFRDHFEGKIDEPRIYNRALGAKEVRPDTTPPTSPFGIEATYEEGAGNSYITWEDSLDPASAGGPSASGVKEYRYKYRLEGGAWSSEQTTAFTAFEIGGTSEGETIIVSLTAEDREGNVSPIRTAHLTSLPSTLGPEDIGTATTHEESSSIVPEPDESSSGAEMLAVPFLSPQPNFTGNEPCAEEIEDPCGQYSPRGAEEYAHRWTLPGRHNEYVEIHHNENFAYHGGEGGDCTNYASQVLWGGNMQFLGTDGHDQPREVGNKYEEVKYSWFSGVYEDSGEHHGHQLYSQTTNFSRAQELYEHLLHTGLGEEIKHGPFHPGDLIFFDLFHGDDPSQIDHTQVIERVTSKHVWIVQHSQSYRITLRQDKEENLEKPPYQIDGKKHWEWFFVRPIHTKFDIFE